MPKISYTTIKQDIESNKENIPPYRFGTIDPSFAFMNASEPSTVTLRHPLEEIPCGGPPLVDLNPPRPHSVIPIPYAPPKPRAKKDDHCPDCRLPTFYDHVACRRGLVDGWTCQCKTKVPPLVDYPSPSLTPDPNDIVIVRPDTPHPSPPKPTPSPPAPLADRAISISGLYENPAPRGDVTVDQLDAFYSNANSYVTVRDMYKEIPHYQTFDWMYVHHRNIQEQIKSFKQTLLQMEKSTEQFSENVQCALDGLARDGFPAGRFCKKSIDPNCPRQTVTTYLYESLPRPYVTIPRQRKSARHVASRTPYLKNQPSGSRSNPIVVDPPHKPCPVCNRHGHIRFHCPKWQCKVCSRTAPGHGPRHCPQKNRASRSPTHSGYDYIGYDDDIYGDADGHHNLEGEC